MANSPPATSEHYFESEEAAQTAAKALCDRLIREHGAVWIRLKRLDDDEAQLSRIEEATMSERIVIHPDICNGRLVIAGTRVMAQTVVEFLAAGDTPEDIIAEYPYLTRKDILACLAYSS